MNTSCVFGQTNRSITDRNFSGGEVTTVFGNTRIDLADTVLANNEATINITVVCGGVTFRVPGSWAVDVQATTIFGDVTDNRARPLPEDGQERVTITGACLFSQIVLES